MNKQDEFAKEKEEENVWKKKFNEWFGEISYEFSIGNGDLLFDHVVCADYSWGNV